MKKIMLSLLFLSSIFFYSCSSKQLEDITAFTNVNVIPMNKEIIIPNQTVIIKDEHIIIMGNSDKIEVPPSAVVIDGTGKYLLPGLSDMHMHSNSNWNDKSIWPVSPLSLYLANGITTIRCLGPGGYPLDYFLRLRSDIEEGLLDGPVIFGAGPALKGPLEKNPLEIVEDYKNEGFDLTKVYTFLSSEKFFEIMSAAKEFDMYVAGHIPITVGLDGIIDEGMNEIAHIDELVWELFNLDREYLSKSQFNEKTEYMFKMYEDFFPDTDVSTEFIEEKISNQLIEIAEKIKSNNISIVTTVIVQDVIERKFSDPEKLLSDPNFKYMPVFVSNLKEGTDQYFTTFKGYEKIPAIHSRIVKLFLKYLKNEDALLVAASDSGNQGIGGIPGFSLHYELELLVENGFTPFEALELSTVNAAQVITNMKGDGNFGIVEVGKRAELLLLSDNPLADIKNTKKIEGVMVYGRWYSKETLNKMVKKDEI